MPAVETSKVSEQGAVTLSAYLRRRFGMKEGSLVIAEETQEGILIRPAGNGAGEVYTPQRKAEFILSSAIDADDYARAVAEVRAMGLDPATISHHKPDGA